LYSRCEFSDPWALELPEFEASVMFHIVISGQCWLEVDGEDPSLLGPGDLALIPHGDGHRLASEPGLPAARLFDLPREMVSERYEILRHGGGGAATTLVCGAVRFDHPAAHHLVSVLPGLIRVEAAASLRLDWVQNWTVANLAAEVAMSRSAFSARFTELVGEPPIHYVTRWRMHVAQAALLEDEATLGELALRLGYGSEAAFSRAFKRFMGVSPGAVRRSGNAPAFPIVTATEVGPLAGVLHR